MTANGITFLHLPWQDIIFDKIFIYLIFKEIIILRAISTQFKLLITEYMKICHRLDVSNTQIKDDSLTGISWSCENLKTLSVCGCQKLQGIAVAELIAKNKMLESCNIGYCPLLKHEVFQTLSKNCLNLKKLYIGHCVWLNGEHLEIIIQHFQHLECLHIEKCSKIGRDILYRLFNRYPNLKELNLSHIEGVDENVLEQLARKCRSISHLNLNNCWKITESGISKILEWCPNLRSLEVKFCPKISDAFLASVSERGINVHTTVIKRHVHLALNIQI